jgi:hypothetical protein
MASFKSIAQGPRQRKATKLPLSGARFNVERGDWDGPTIALDVIPLGESEHADVLKFAREYAMKRGVADPGPSDELYERGVMVKTIALACVDIDVKDAETPFFVGGAEEIEDSKSLLPEVVAYLYKVQQLHQDECNPLLKDFSPAEYMAGLARTAAGDISFFVSSRPGTQWSFVRTLASQQLSSMTRGSGSGGPSEAAPSMTGG